MISEIIRFDTKTRFTELMAFADQHWPHKVPHETRLTMPSPERNWCVERYGPCASFVHHDERGEGRLVTLETQHLWCETGSNFLFRNPDHAFEFKMRWFNAPDAQGRAAMAALAGRMRV